MKLQKETVGVTGLDANSMKKYSRLTVKISDGNAVQRTEATYDDGTKNFRTSVPVRYGEENTHISFGKSNINKIIDALGDETEAWTGAEIDLIVVEYASLGKQGFDIEAIRAAKTAAPQKPADLILEKIAFMDGGKGAPIKAVQISTEQANPLITADVFDIAILGLKNEGKVLELKGQMLKVV